MMKRKVRRRVHTWKCTLLGGLLSLLVLCVMGAGWKFEVESRDHISPEGQNMLAISDQTTADWMNGLIYNRNPELSAEEKKEFIFIHPELYIDGLLELAEKNEEAIDYVYAYPFRAYSDETWDLAEEAASDTIPLLIQWDERWGYHRYGSGLIGYTGCGPTCLSMVSLFLTGDSTYDPSYIAEYAEGEGYYVKDAGTSWELMRQGCQAFGLTSRELSLDERTIHAALDGGEPIICAMGKGDFTDQGHFIVIAGYEDGGLRIHDPNSPLRSERLWDFEQIRYQIRNLWAFHLLSENETP